LSSNSCLKGFQTEIRPANQIISQVGKVGLPPLLVLPQCFKTLCEAALTAREHWRVAQRVGAGFCLT
jgi:hypothetical protein